MRGLLPFRDRSEAGRKLGEELASIKLSADPIVLALPRGGLPVGVAVAEALHAPLDIVVARKLGVPWQPELAMGAIAGSTRVLDSRIIFELGVSDEEIEEAAGRELHEMKRREDLYRGGAPPPDLRGRSVILVDDGIATGSTMVAAARQVRSGDPREVIVAVPVSSSEAASRLRREADQCVCLAYPEPFVAVGCWYEDFAQVGDAEVRELLKQSHHAV